MRCKKQLPLDPEGLKVLASLSPETQRLLREAVSTGMRAVWGSGKFPPQLSQAQQEALEEFGRRLNPEQA